MPELYELAGYIAKIEDGETVRQFLDEILTPAEKNTLALRWQLMKKLKQGIPQRQIASDLGISLCKITRGSKILKSENSITNMLLSKGEHNE